jgi:hypothetical protein
MHSAASGPVNQEREACKFVLRSAARRWRHLADKIADLDVPIAYRSDKAAPAQLNQFGVGSMSPGNSDRSHAIECYSI